jgi:hypothetical protein
MSMLASRGVYGLRLDAAAYYGKIAKGSIRHNAESVRLTGELARLAEEHGLRPYPQLDIDAQTLPYVEALAGTRSVLVDLAFPAVVYSALGSGDPSLVTDHCRVTAERGLEAMRGPRTHDGVLLRSASVSETHIASLDRLARRARCKLRYTGGSVYELNASGPALARALCPGDPTRVIALVMVLSALLTRHPYFYLPAVLGFEPEKARLIPSDPRALNRVPIPADQRRQLTSHERLNDLRKTLATAAEIAASADEPADLSAEGTELHVTRGPYRLAANFGTRSDALDPFEYSLVRV